MHHGQRLVLLVYLHLTLEIQYNTILIIINSIYIILLFANKQWGLSFNDNIHSSIVNLPISFKKTPLLAVASDSNLTTIGIISIGNTQIKITDNNTGTTTRINYLVFGV